MPVCCSISADVQVTSSQSPGLFDLAFSPDGKMLAVACRDGTLRLFVLPTDELIALAHSRVTRSLTEEECQKILHLDACPPGP